MQIDTRNRNPKYINDTTFHPGIMPMNSAAPENAQYSGLPNVRAPTRIKKTIHYNYQFRISGECGGTNKISQEECQKLSPYNNIPKVVSNNNIPRDCSFINGVNYYNTYNSTASCGNNSTLTGHTSFYATFNDTTTNVSSSIYYNKLTNIVEISLFGPR